MVKVKNFFKKLFFKFTDEILLVDDYVSRPKRLGKKEKHIIKKESDKLYNEWCLYNGKDTTGILCYGPANIPQEYFIDNHGNLTEDKFDLNGKIYDRFYSLVEEHIKFNSKTKVIV